jgi:hypothetical protein
VYDLVELSWIPGIPPRAIEVLAAKGIRTLADLEKLVMAERAAGHPNAIDAALWKAGVDALDVLPAGYYLAGFFAVRRCRECGCTDEDCSQCVARTGRPCTWVEPDLCSACKPKRTRKAS